MQKDNIALHETCHNTKKNMKKRPKDPLDSSFGFFENIKRL
jgi:hypothetical protein